jgi:hypothetical protein
MSDQRMNIGNWRLDPQWTNLVEAERGVRSSGLNFVARNRRRDLRNHFMRNYGLDGDLLVEEVNAFMAENPTEGELRRQEFDELLAESPDPLDPAIRVGRAVGTSVIQGISFPADALQATLYGVSAPVEGGVALGERFRNAGAALGTQFPADETIANRFGRWASRFSNYNPIAIIGNDGAIEPRPITGRMASELFITEALNIPRYANSPEWVKDTVGIASDILVDPLLFAPVLRGIGRAFRSDATVTAANAIESALSPNGVLRMGGAVGRQTLGRIAPQTTQAIEEFAVRSINGFLNGTMRLSADRTVMTGEFLFPGGGFNPLRPDADVLSGGAGRPRIAMDAERNARVDAAAFSSEATQHLADLSVAWGRTEMQRVLGANVRGITDWATDLQQRLAPLPANLQGAISELTSGVMERQGALLRDEALGFLDDVPINRPGFASSVGEELRGLRPTASNLLARGEQEWQAALGRIEQIATREGISVDNAQTVFRDLVGRTQAAEALVNFRNTLYEPVKVAFIEAMQRSGAKNPRVAQSVWSDIARRFQENPSTLMEDITTWRDSLGKETPFDQLFSGIRNAADLTRQTPYGGPGMNISNFFRDIYGGDTLRRVYAMVGTPESTANWVRTIQEGRAAMSNIVQDDVMRQISQNTPHAPAAQLLNRFIRDVAPTSNSRGAILRQDEVLRYMTEKGLPAQEAEAFWSQVVKRTNPQQTRLIDDMERARTDWLDPVADRTARSATSLSRQDLEAIGLMSDPLLSLAENTLQGVKGMEVTSALGHLYNDAFRLGYVRDRAPQGLDWVRIEKDRAGGMSAWGGKWVPAPLAREISNIAASGRAPGDIARAWNRVRGMITGGFLASPSTTTANFIGGVYSAALYGYNPFRFAAETFRVLRDWSVAANAGEEFADEVVTRPALLGRGVIANEVKPLAELIDESAISRLLEGGTPASFQENVRRGAEGLSNWYVGLLENPTNLIPERFIRARGIRRVGAAFGLEAFERVENAMKIAAMRITREQTGDMALALERARNVVFDYAAQPELIRGLRNTGVVPFPAFPYFMFGRMVNGIMNRPGVVGAFDRLREGAFEAGSGFDAEVATAISHTMEDYMVDNGNVPMYAEFDAGDDLGPRFWTVPFNQLIPSDALNLIGSGSAMVESLGALGILGPIQDLLAHDEGGFGPNTGRFGQQVKTPESTGFQAFQQQAQFVYNNFAPAGLRKMVNFGRPADGRLEGVVPRLVEQFGRPANQLDVTANEFLRNRSERGLREELIAYFLRSPQAVSFASVDNDVVEMMQDVQRDHERKVRSLETQLERTSIDLDNALRQFPRSSPNVQDLIAQGEALSAQIERIGQEFDEWAVQFFNRVEPALDNLQEMRQRRESRR